MLSFLLGLLSARLRARCARVSQGARAEDSGKCRFPPSMTARFIESCVAGMEESVAVCLFQRVFFNVTNTYEPLHQQVNKFWATLDRRQSESDRISLAAKKFDLTRDQVREILGLKDLLQFSED